jgi:hypothetical protein
MGEATERFSNLLGKAGLIVRSGFNFNEGETAPQMRGRPARSVILIGHGGGGFWTQFAMWLEGRHPTPANPLDTWSREVIDDVAELCGASAVYPSDIPYLPFQQWAMRAEGLKPSPLGILMHPHFGLWHAYRGALLFDHELDIAPVENVIHPCDRCDGKPCVNSCPVDAFSASGYAVEDCRAHVASPDGYACRNAGCLDRNACPYAAEYRYSAAQQAFHMSAFLRGTSGERL